MVVTLSFMEVNWQTDNPPNPADAKDGLQAYDQHLYYYFGVSLLMSTFFFIGVRLNFAITGHCRPHRGGLLGEHLQ